MQLDDLFAYLLIAAFFALGPMIWYSQRVSRIEGEKWIRQLREHAKSKAIDPDEEADSCKLTSK